MKNDFDRNTYHLMEIKLSQISARYLLCKEWLSDESGKVSSGEKNTEDHFASYVKRVEKSFQGLDENQLKVITNDFFNQFAFPFWWESFFAKSTYYRIKKIAMTLFLKNFRNA